MWIEGRIWHRVVEDSGSYQWGHWGMVNGILTDKRRNSNVIITSKRHRNVIVAPFVRWDIAIMIRQSYFTNPTIQPSHIPHYTTFKEKCPISHNTPLWNRNVYIYVPKWSIMGNGIGVFGGFVRLLMIRAVICRHIDAIELLQNTPLLRQWLLLAENFDGNILIKHTVKSLTLRVTGLCVWGSPVTGGFPAETASNAENVSIFIMLLWFDIGPSYPYRSGLLYAH